MKKEKGKCPKCGQYKATGMGTLGISIFFLGWIPLFFGLFFPLLLIVSFILIFFGFILTIVNIIATIAGKPKTLFCMNCHYKWEEKIIKK